MGIISKYALLLGILLPTLLIPFFFIPSKSIKKYAGLLAMMAPLASLGIILSIANKVGIPQVNFVNWIPELGIHFSFLIDGISLFFSITTCMMGALVCAYSHYYLPKSSQKNSRFYAYLLFFITAMLGTVLSNNIGLLIVFWELTAIASFLLIGFKSSKEGSQKGALATLITTGFTGLCMLVGLILLSILTGTSELSEVLILAPTLTQIQPYLTTIMVLILIGAFGKSAQFPFYFWLPKAMSAPTPVSAYLHSAAMVKLGIFLIARFYPIFGGNSLWAPILITIGVITMVIGAVYAVMTHDIKELLAYSTVSQLGALVMSYGLGTTYGVEHDFYQILNHIFYKGALFMAAGVAIHTFDTQDLRKMGGLFKFAPIAGIAAVISVGAMIGFPGTTGFISKELLLHTILTIPTQKENGIILAAMLVAAIGLVIAGIRFLTLFFGNLKGLSEEHIDPPSMGIQLPIIIAASFSLIFGLFPQDAVFWCDYLRVAGLHYPSPASLSIWQGITNPLILSGGILTVGAGISWVLYKRKWVDCTLPETAKLETKFDHLLNTIQKISTAITAGVKTDHSPDYLMIILGFIAGLLLLILLPLFPELILPFLFKMDDTNTLGSLTAILIGGAAIATLIAKTNINKLIAISVVGALISFYFLLYHAPDLALTNLMIEAIGVVLMVLLLIRLPKEDTSQKVDGTLRKTANITIASTIGVIATSLILLMTNNQVLDSISGYFIEATVPLAGGSNAVNTILVDFRGFDTMGEISVLVIAAIGVIGLLWKKGGSINQ